MIAKYKKKANIFLIIGFIIAFAGNGIKATTDPTLGNVVFWVGNLTFVYGCVQYVKAKGYHWGWGLLGLLNFIGLLVLVFFKDKHKN